MALPMGPCCATGSLHTGKPTGTVKKVHGLDCYVAEPPNGSPSGIVVIIPDAFGWVLPNNRILADEFAKKGFLVYLPDYMNGYSCSADCLIALRVFKESGGLLATLNKIYWALLAVRHMVPFVVGCRQSVTGPRVYSFAKALRANEGKDLPIGVAGYCWGGFWVTKLCTDTIKTDDGKRLVDVGFVGHPSMLKYPEDIEAVKLPYSCAAPEHDLMVSPRDKEQTKTVLQAKTAKTKDAGIEHEFVLYEGAWHGFAVRADEDEKHEAAQGKKAEEQAVAWFQRWFKNPPPSV